MRHAEREIYRLHAKLPAHQRHVETAKQAVAHALRCEPGLWAVGISGGKDSTCLIDLCHSAGWRGPAFHMRFAETPPENTALCLALADRYSIELQIADLPGELDVYERLGHFFVHAESTEERAAVAEMVRGYKVGADEFAEQRGHHGQFWGMRAAESKHRAITVARKGVLYRTRSRRTVTCLPLARWSDRDIWAYTVSRDLPWLSIYDTADDRDRARSEFVFLGCEALWRHGQGALLRRHDPAWWSDLVSRFPNLSTYS